MFVAPQKRRKRKAGAGQEEGINKKDATLKKVLDKRRKKFLSLLLSRNDGERKAEAEELRRREKNRWLEKKT